MKHPLLKLLPLVAFALYPVERASAIAMNLSLGSFAYSYSESAGNPSGDMDSPPFGSLPVAVTTSPLNLGYTIAASSWSFVNTPTQAVWSGAQTLNNFGAVSPFFSTAKAHGELRFLLGERVSYSVTGSFLASLNDGATSRSFAQLADRGVMEGQPIPIYTESDQLTGISGFNRFGDGVGSLVGTNTGILEPGGYLFIFGAEIRNGNGGTGNGSFTFTLARSVPDAGSTLTLLGIALGGLGFIRRSFPPTCSDLGEFAGMVGTNRQAGGSNCRARSAVSP